MADEFMKIFEEFGRIKDQDPGSSAAGDLVYKLQKYITDHFYKCSDEILLSLGMTYASGGEFTENIDGKGGPGTGAFVNEAIRSHRR